MAPMDRKPEKIIPPALANAYTEAYWKYFTFTQCAINFSIMYQFFEIHSYAIKSQNNLKTWQ